MTNFEALKGLDEKSLGYLMCRLYREYEGEYEDRCDGCPVRRLCGPGHNGYITWLERENKEDLREWLS